VVISFIVPAHNEELLIGRTLASIHNSARRLGVNYEIIVANDASTDRTGAIADAHGAGIVNVNHRQISATRNAGAAAATGDIFIFVDADTVINARVVRAALRALRRGVAGGGCTIRTDGKLPLYGAVVVCAVRVFQPILGIAGGCFLFCTRQSYLSAGGFDATMFAAEEVDFGARLRRQGRFVILRDCVITSGRKLRAHSALDLLRIGIRFAREGREALRRREGLEFWYGPREAAPAESHGFR
jgi:glycosyltransferase involved in cell wall biosynthesis